MAFIQRILGRVCRVVAVGACFMVCGWARAGNDPAFTPEDFKAQTLMLRHLNAAARAVRKCDGKRAKMELRLAASAGHYEFANPADASSRCGGPLSFVLPDWLPEAQAALGDVEGACYTAQNAPLALFTFQALERIVRIQQGESFYSSSFVFDYAVAARMEADDLEDENLRRQGKTRVSFQSLSFEEFATSPCKPNRREALTTLRTMAPYAVLVSRIGLPLMPVDPWYPRAIPVVAVAELQAKSGDLATALKTLALIREPWEQAAGLAHIAAVLPRPRANVVLAQARQAIAALPVFGQRAVALMYAVPAWSYDEATERNMLTQALHAARHETNRAFADALTEGANARLSDLKKWNLLLEPSRKYGGLPYL